MENFKHVTQFSNPADAQAYYLRQIANISMVISGWAYGQEDKKANWTDASTTAHAMDKMLEVAEFLDLYVREV